MKRLLAEPLCHFRERGCTPRGGRLTDEEYGHVLDYIVVSCVDCIVVSGEEMLLGYRAQEPYIGWWVMGGRMLWGECPEQTAQRVLQREVSLEISDLHRFTYVGTNSYVWERRAQPPEDHGCHMVGINYCLRISDAEKQVTQRAEDFQKIQWMNAREILAHPMFHPAILGFAKYVYLFSDLI